MLAGEARDRKLELKRKQDRLTELKQARLARGESIPGLSSTIQSSKSILSKEDVDNLIMSLIGPPLNNMAVDQAPDTIIPSTSSKQQSSLIKDLTFDTELNVINLIPEEKVTYSKEMQTDEILSQSDEAESAKPEIFITAEDNSKERSSKSDYEESLLLPDRLNTVDEVRKVTEIESVAILKSENFQTFLDQSSKVIERALYEDYDILKDYTQDLDLDDSSRFGADRKDLVLKMSLMHERWSHNRVATCVHWSPFFPELVLVSFNKNTSNSNECDGLILVWNIRMPSRPEFVLFSQSEVTVAKFSPFQPNIIFGGTYSGQVLIWNTRMKNTPIISTSLSLPGHSHPVYSMEIVGTHNANNLITVSTDGTLCSWPSDILNEPQELTELIIQNEGTGFARYEEVSVTCMAFSRIETSSFFIGTEERNIYQVNRFDRAGNKAGIEKGIIYEGHQSSITGIGFHPFCSSDSIGLFLSCSMDWTIKLWKVQSPSSNTCIHASPLKSFEEGSDYISDVAWSPVHPAVFSAIDGSGNIYIFNLLENPDAAVLKISSPNSRGCNKLSWDKNGERLAVCSLDGTCFVFDASPFSKPKADDFARLIKSLV